MTTDASALKPQEKRKPSSFYMDEEEIIVKPSTELIPDEYQHYMESMPAVHVFKHSFYGDNFEEKLVSCFKEVGYAIDPKKNVHDFDEKQDFIKNIKSIQANILNANGLILIVMGLYKENDGAKFLLWDENGEVIQFPIKEIWNIFTTDNCKELKRKPKIFIFCASKFHKGVQSDSAKHQTALFSKVYDFPAESDMLIVYKKNTDAVLKPIEDFLGEFSEIIKMYSKKYDIIDLIHHSHSKDQRQPPIIISTLTRKFYLTSSDQREHYLSLIENHIDLRATLDKIREDVQKLHDLKKKKKENKFFSSFRRKPEEKVQISKKDKPQENIKERSTSPKLLPSASPPTKGSKEALSPKDSQAARKTSVQSGGSRSRTTSFSQAETDFDRKQPERSSKSKPRWKY